MAKVDLMNKGAREALIQKRLQAFDQEAAAAEDTPAVKAELRRYFEEELASAASLVQNGKPGRTDYARLRGSYALREIEAESATGFAYPKSDMKAPPW